MPAIFYADLHAKTHPWVGRPGMRRDAAYAIKQIAELSGEYEADVIDGGDTYDVPRPEGEVVMLQQAMIHHVTRMGHIFAYVYGNHSSFPLVTSPDLVDRAVYLPYSELFIGDHRVVGFDHMSRSRVQEALPDIPLDVSAVVCHWCFKEAFDWGVSHLTLDDTPSHVKLWAVGHIHKKTHVTNGRGQTLIYPGSPYVSRLDDDPDGGVWLINDDLSLEHIVLDKRAVMRRRVETQDDVESLIVEAREERRTKSELMNNEFSNDISQPIVVVSWFIDKMPGVGKTVAEALDGIAHVFEYPLDSGSEKIAKDMQDSGTLSESQLSLPAFLPQEVNREESPVVYDALNQFLGGASVQQCMREAGLACGLSSEELKRIIPSIRE